MQVEGQEVLQAPVERVWEALNDPAVLQRCTPGLKSLEVEAEDRYRGTAEIGIGPLRGTFQGRVEVRDKQPHERLTLYAEGQSRIGGVQAQGLIRLTPQGQDTLVSYSGEARLRGPLATLGNRVLQVAARSLARQFFESLARELDQTKGG